MGHNQIAETVTGWWQEIKDNSGARARLRRCATPEEAALLPETHRLRVRLPAWVKIETVATIAGLTARIEKKNNKPLPAFATSLATPKNGRIPFSESRFRQLLQSRSWDELYRNLRRALDIVDCQVDVKSLVEVILKWDKEFSGDYIQPGKGIKFSLSRDYYTPQL